MHTSKMLRKSIVLGHKNIYTTKKAEGKLLWGKLNLRVYDELNMQDYNSWQLQISMCSLPKDVLIVTPFTTYHQLVKATENQLMPPTAVDLRMVLHYV